MGGGLMQLVAYGAQDIYLTGNPQITFFKVVYRRHTNFSMEAITQTLNGSTQGTAGQTATCTISRNGDLVSKVYVNYAGGASKNGSALIKEVELEIGGQRIDRHYQEWNELWNELSTDESKAIGLKSMQRCIGNSDTTGAKLVQVPLNFWFCRNPGLALPLIALQYHEVKIKFTWGNVDGVSTPNPDVVCDYIYLDTDERRRFAQVSHEYLIEQVQKEDKTVASTGSNTHKLNFNHPVKELIWTTLATDELSAVKLTLNGHDRFSERGQEYFTLRQPFDYHTAVPRQNLPSAGQGETVGMSNLETIFSGVDKAEATPGTYAEGGNSIAVNQFIALQSAITSAGAGDAGLRKFIQVVNAEALDFTNGDRVLVQFGDVGTPANNFSVITTVKNKTITTNTTAIEFTDDVHDGANSASAGATLSVTKIAASAQARTSKMVNKINVYSFALKPEEHQPSGTCNFSRIDNANLIMTHSANAGDPVTIYAVNYNVLRIMSGMGGLAYSN
jgi:hypothetical protein